MKFVWWVVFLVLLSAGVALFLWWRGIEPVFSLLQPLMTAILTFDLSKVQAISAAGYAGIVSIVSALLGVIYKWRTVVQEKLAVTGQLFAFKEQANTTLAQASTEIAAKEQELTALAQEKTSLLTNNTALTEKLAEMEQLQAPMKNQIQELQLQLDQARQQLTGLSKLNVDTLAEQTATRLAEKQRVA